MVGLAREFRQHHRGRRLAGETRAALGSPGKGRLAAPALERVPAERIADGRARPHRVLAPVEQVLARVCDQRRDGRGQELAAQERHREDAFRSQQFALRLDRLARLHCGGAETIRPPVGIGGAVHFDFLERLGVPRNVVHEHRGRRAHQAHLTPARFVPAADEVALLPVRRRIVDVKAAVGNGEGVERIARPVQPVEEGVQLGGEVFNVQIVDAPHVAQMVNLGPEREHLAPARRLPTVDRGIVERHQRTVGILAHPGVFDADLRGIVGHAPGDAVNVALHQCFDRNALLVHKAQLTESMAERRVVAHFAHVEEHAGDFDVALHDPAFEASHLLRRTRTQEVEHRARSLARPVELRIGRIVRRHLAVVERVVDVLYIVRDDLRLRTRKADVRMRMLHQVHGLRPDRSDRQRRQDASCDAAVSESSRRFSIDCFSHHSGFPSIITG